MIIIYHNNSSIEEVYDHDLNIALEFDASKNVVYNLFEFANRYKNTFIIWCHSSLRNELNHARLPSLLHHKKIMLSYNCAESYIISDFIEYVDTSFFVNPNRQVSFATYKMSSDAGAIHAEVLSKVENEIEKSDGFDYFLCSLAKLAITEGLLCYSNPELLINRTVIQSFKRNCYLDYKFISQHWKTQWLFVLFINLLLYERKITLLPLIRSLFYRRRKLKSDCLQGIKVYSSKKVITSKDMDVIIPTIGRKEYLHDVLKDFSSQTILPKKIIIVEQNIEQNSVSELDYLRSEKFPFEVKHIFTHQAGACNARNTALAETTSEWVFLADDDNRFEKDLIESIFNLIADYAGEAVSACYIQRNEIKTSHKIVSSAIFGAGNSFIKQRLLKDVKFDSGFEFGYGEDNDFGMQIRNLGIDVLYLPKPEILHLKAPVGGFRTKPRLAWQHELVQPKPSPTVMLFNLKHNTLKQTSAKKTMLCINYYKVQQTKNPIKYIRYFNRQWNVSKLWAHKLLKS